MTLHGPFAKKNEQGETTRAAETGPFRQMIKLWSSALTAALLLLTFIVLPAHAQDQKIVNCPAIGMDLISIPEIKSENGYLRGTITLTNDVRVMWDSGTTLRCATQQLRLLKGQDLQHPMTWPSGPEPIPGPTLRAKVGDLVELTFLNQVDPQQFYASLDQAERGATSGCDTFTSAGAELYPGTGGDTMPNCLHGSTTSNIHFHGTHTTPNTTGDNVLLYIRPALRVNGQLEPSDSFVKKEFASIFANCEKYGTPTSWSALPDTWTKTGPNSQEALLKKYDSTAVYQGQRGALPHDMQLWPKNDEQIHDGQWPQYQLGAYPYCFRIPALLLGGKKYEMYQAPGTHWYHAHKHGSTALNVANGMVGAFIIEGQYDKDLRNFYGEGLREKVLLIEELSSAPFELLNPNAAGPPGTQPPLAVNGRRQPVIKMRPNEVQLWRIINADFRDAVILQNVTPPGSSTPCSKTSTPCVDWRQIAQDGVQFSWDNYNRIGTLDNSFNMASANRADLLVRAPSVKGTYSLNVQPNITPTSPRPAVVLLTISVQDDAVNPAMNFIEDPKKFPTFPAFLHDITDQEVDHRMREMTFGAGFNTIDGKTFNGHEFDQTMRLNTAEEWTVKSIATNKAHPFHIHVNPFQITEVFQPTSASAQKGGSCYADPLKPDTWHSCNNFEHYFVWWDTFAIPIARKDNLPASVCTQLEKCPGNIQKYTTCTAGSNPVCTVTIPGHFKMRSRFVDFPGQFVLHCHILIHEDRGMMQLIQVVPNLPYVNHD